MIRYDPTLVDLTNNFFVLCTNVKVYLYNYSSWVELSMICTKERVKYKHIISSAVPVLAWGWFGPPFFSHLSVPPTKEYKIGK